MKWSFVKFEWIGRSGAAEVTLRKHRWFRKPVEHKFRGRCTVWRDTETGRRAPQYLDMYLADIWSSEVI
jgi:hypothetical protein